MKENNENIKCCIKCNINKSLSSFSLDKGIKCGYKNVCKECNNLMKKIRRKNNPDKTKSDSKKYRLNRIAKTKEDNKKYRLNNREKINEKQRNRIINKENKKISQKNIAITIKKN